MALSAAGRLALLLLLALALALSAQAARPDPGLLNDEAPVLQQSIVDRVNSNKNAGWKAGMTARFEGAKLKDLKRLCGSLITPVNSFEPSIPVRTYPKDLELPKFFDSREAWPHCSTVSTILDQGHCGSCWAFGAVESLTDRFCTVANVTVTLSENDLLSCCGFECGFGCDGGYPYKAWQYFQRTGVVTSQCNPYFDATGCGHPGCSPVYETPKCVRECVNDEVWTDSKHYGVSVYGVSSNPRDIMAEIYQNGPVEVSFIVYEDFAHYESGVYKHLYGQVSGGHAVKLIGWGTTDDGIDYWLLVNSWNKNWGENGYFRMIRGINDCGIEGSVVAGLPNTQNLLHAAY